MKFFTVFALALASVAMAAPTPSTSTKETPKEYGLPDNPECPKSLCKATCGDIPSARKKKEKCQAASADGLSAMDLNPQNLYDAAGG
ncbi:hypothetical protein HYALB_00001707 [Hymenoscyphus albidus]|uniref:Uncharacterized protein n=1 Tax=Hymenoscyphus albidus TaxID=595503 RepID=A0A9N9LBP6_9HELO|nr:hypothetical protein HYALB_00001707 [Hymenoscyphus albidus]